MYLANNLTINYLPILTRATFVLLLIVAGFCSSAQTSNLPDLRGNYYFTNQQGNQLSSTIYSNKAFSVKSDQGVKHVKVLKKVDKMRVHDIVTYFVDVQVTDDQTKESQKMEMVLVENETLKRIRMELETGEEWIRLVPNSSGTSPVRR